MYCPPKLPFFIKNVPLNFTICCIYLHEVLYPTIFLPYERTSVFYYNMLTRGAYPSGISSSRLDMKLNFIPVIPSVKKLQSVALTCSRGRYMNYRSEANFY